MRYRVRSADDVNHEHVLALLRNHHVAIALRNDQRRLLAIENLSDDLRSELIDLGATVAPDIQYAPD